MSEKKIKVLIVDDEAIYIMALGQILSPNYTLFAVKTGKDAVENAEKCLPDAVLLDIIMPDMDGYETLAALKNSERTKNIPVIFISSLAQDADVKKGMDMGAADYIFKPFTADVVLQKIKEALEFSLLPL